MNSFVELDKTRVRYVQHCLNCLYAQNDLFISINSLQKELFSILNVNKKFWEDLIGYFLPVLQRPHRKRLIQQFLYSFICILCRGNIFTYVSDEA
jgi:hypothetical protein